MGWFVPRFGGFGGSVIAHEGVGSHWAPWIGRGCVVGWF